MDLEPRTGARLLSWNLESRHAISKAGMELHKGDAEVKAKLGPHQRLALESKD